MNFSVISEDEAKKKYAAAENKTEMIKILSELMCAKKAEIHALLGIDPPKRDVRCSECKDLIAELYHDGVEKKLIADIVGVKYPTVCAWIRRKLAQPKNPEAKLHAEMVDNKKWELYEKGLNDAEIAAEIGLRSAAIFYWRKRRDLPPNGKRGGWQLRRGKNGQKN